jgi:hypothetical protein
MSMNILLSAIVVEKRKVDRSEPFPGIAAPGLRSLFLAQAIQGLPATSPLPAMHFAIPES